MNNVTAGWGGTNSKCSEGLDCEETDKQTVQLYIILLETGNQWSCNNNGDTWSYLLAFETIRAARFWIRCSLLISVTLMFIKRELALSRRLKTRERIAWWHASFVNILLTLDILYKWKFNDLQSEVICWDIVKEESSSTPRVLTDLEGSAIASPAKR